MNGDAATIIPRKIAINVTIAKKRGLTNRDSTPFIVLLQKKAILKKKVYAILAFALRESSKGNYTK